MPFLAGISSFFDKYILGYAIGTAAGPSLEPFVQDLANLAWTENQVMPPDAMILAEGVAQGQVDPAQAQTWASQTGFGTEQFQALVDIANVGPGIGYAYEAWRRGLLTQAEFTTALKRTGLEEQWNAALVGLHDTLLSSQELANLQQQGFVTEDEANAEGGLQGVTPGRQQLRFEAAGLPPGIAEGLTMWRRGIIDQPTFDQIVREGHTKTKYTGALEQLKAQPLSHLQYVEARVRGWIDNAAMYAGGALWGFSQADMDTLHKTHGRPLSWHQVWIGLQRGGKRLDPTADLTAASLGIDETFFAALQQSDIQQQWYDLAWAQRYSYPAPFVLRTLAQAGEIDAATLTQVLTYIGWEPTFITKVVDAWTGGTGTTAAQKKQTLSHLTQEYLSGALSAANLTTLLTTSLGYTAQQAADEIALAEFNASKAARTKATNAIGKRVIALQLSPADATTALEQMGWPAGAVEKFIAAWNEERLATLTTLTVSQIAAALKAGALLASQATPLLQDLGEDAQAIAAIIATSGANPAT
jgi:hypothetical protein